MVIKTTILAIIYSLIGLVYGDYCSSCRTVAQGAELALEEGQDIKNFVSEQCQYHEILYYTHEQIFLCKEIAAKIVADYGIQKKLRQPGSSYTEVCIHDLGYCT